MIVYSIGNSRRARPIGSIIDKDAESAWSSEIARRLREVENRDVKTIPRRVRVLASGAWASGRGAPGSVDLSRDSGRNIPATRASRPSTPFATGPIFSAS